MFKANSVSLKELKIHPVICVLQTDYRQNELTLLF